jgi:hypothetical protein
LKAKEAAEQAARLEALRNIDVDFDYRASVQDTKDTDVRIGCHGSPRLGDWLAFNKDLPSHHSPRGLIHSWKKTAFNK